MPQSCRPKLLVVSCGGTWCMRNQASASSHVFRTHRVPKPLGGSFDFAATFPAVNDFADVTFHEWSAIDSSNMGPEQWSALSRFIAARYELFDAYVVLQGTDTLAFTASALSYSLHGLIKPVVLTGAQLSLDVPGSDAQTNVVNACRLATLRTSGNRPALTEVVVVFGTKIIRATRCRKYSECDLEAFDSVNVPVVGRFRTTLTLNRDMLTATGPRRGRFIPSPAFDPNVSLVTLYPGILPDVFRVVAGHSSAVVVAAFGAGNIPSSSAGFVNCLSLERPIQETVDRGKPVVITTQCVTGQAEIGRYEAGSCAQRAGAIIANDMTPEAAYVKVSWLLENEAKWSESHEAKRALKKGRRRDAFRYALLHPYSGEVSSNRQLFSLCRE